jgi:MFS family permease
MSIEKKELVKIIKASSLGRLIEWYDFYIFGTLATIISSQFFPKGNPTVALLSTLAIFAAGFIVRPFGALIFGRLGDMIGRKYIFLLTLIIMGGSTFAIGLVPKYETIGIAAPLIILLLRLLQGLALGSEYDGATTYLAVHSPEHRRGYFTSWIQTATTGGLLISLSVILLVRHLLDSDPARSIERFNDWGWRIPFLLSIILVFVSIYIRLRMSEPPLFKALQMEGNTSKNPFKESLGHKDNLKMVLLALFGASMGQGVVFYGGQFYVQAILENTCHLDYDQSKTILIFAFIAATPFYLLFGGWSDKIGRKWIMVIGMGLSVITYPILLRELLNLSDPAGRTELPASKEIRNNVAFISKTRDVLRSTSTIHHYEDGFVLTETKKDTLYATGNISLKPTSEISNSLGTGDYVRMVFIIFIMVVIITMVSGPIVGILIELFHTRTRHNSISLPYNVGNGVFGGLTPFIVVLLTTMGHSSKLTGLLYPALVIGLCVIIGAIYIQGRRILDPVKRALGIVWILLGPVALYFLVKTALSEIGRNPIPGTKIQWSTFVVIFIPIAVGLVLFGYYALKGEYNAEEYTPEAVDITID